MNHPSELKYASTHEWVRFEGDLVVTGISDDAQDALGDLVYVETPEVGQQITAGYRHGRPLAASPPAQRAPADGTGGRAHAPRRAGGAMDGGAPHWHQRARKAAGLMRRHQP